MTETLREWCNHTDFDWYYPIKPHTWIVVWTDHWKVVKFEECIAAVRKGDCYHNIRKQRIYYDGINPYIVKNGERFYLDKMRYYEGR